MPDPLPVIPLDYARPTDRPSRWRAVVRVCVSLGWACCAAAWGLIVFADVESVLGTGPLLFTIGVLLVIGGLRTGDRWAAGLGVGHCGICLLFVGLVNLLNWSPADARVPFAVMGALYTLAAVWPTVAAWVAEGRRDHVLVNEWQR